MIQLIKWDKFLLSILELNPVANKKTEPPIPDFEKSLKQLEEIVTKMEGSELTLEQALRSFEEGVALSRQCQQALQQAEVRVNELMSNENKE